MNKRLIGSVAAFLMGAASLAGCQQGPAERAGKGVDNAVRGAKDAINPPGPAEKAGRAVDDVLNK
jgi:hypothetical protein